MKLWDSTCTETGQTNPKSQTRKNQNLILRPRPMKPLKINETAQNFSPYEMGVFLFLCLRRAKKV
jgi:hypothetical protein